MPRSVLVLLVLAVPAPIAAAPIPKERPADVLRRLFGTPSDPDRDCKIELDGTSLRITVPGVPHRLVPNAGPSNAPRVTQSVEGEFTATLTVRAPKPGPDAQGNFYAGLFLSAGDDTFVYHTRRVVAGGGAPVASGLHGLRTPNGTIGSGTSSGEAYTADTVVFRMTRAKGTVRLAASKDGSEWVETAELAADLPARVTVGLFPAHDGQVPLTAEFREFTVTPLKK